MTQLAASPVLGVSGTFWSINNDAEMWMLATYVNNPITISGVPQNNNTQGVTFFLTTDINLNTNTIDPTKVVPGIPANPENPGTYNDPNYQPDQWIPIGGSQTARVGGGALSFWGTFDGQGNTIHNVYINRQGGIPGNGVRPGSNVGIFGNVFWTATIINVNTDGGCVFGQRAVGGIVGRNWGTISNCHNGNFVFGSEAQGTGGIAGASLTDTPTAPPPPPPLPSRSVALVDCCSNHGTIINRFLHNPPGGMPGTFSGTAGGIVGENDCIIRNSWNEGEVGSMFNAGGIAGSNQVRSGAPGNPIVVNVPGSINNCYNRGTVGVTPQYGAVPATTALVAGGIIGFQAGSAQNVYNIGPVSAQSPAASTPNQFAGQIIGQYRIDSAFPGVVNDYFYIYDAKLPISYIGDPANFVPAHGNTFTNTAPSKGTLLSSLNAWVGANAQYSQWTRDTNNVINDGFPTF